MRLSFVSAEYGLDLAAPNDPAVVGVGEAGGEFSLSRGDEVIQHN